MVAVNSPAGRKASSGSHFLLSGENQSSWHGSQSIFFWEPAEEQESRAVKTPGIHISFPATFHQSSSVGSTLLYIYSGDFRPLPEEASLSTSHLSSNISHILTINSSVNVTGYVLTHIFHTPFGVFCHNTQVEKDDIAWDLVNLRVSRAFPKWPPRRLHTTV